MNVSSILLAAQIASFHSDEHPFVVALQFKEEEDIIVALLHDSLEDRYCGEHTIFNLFGPEILESVKILTREDDETYFDYIRRVKRKGGQALKVKTVDARVNFDRCPPGHWGHLRYKKALEILNAENGAS